MITSRAIPGTPLSSYFPDQETLSLPIASAFIKRLHQASITRTALQCITVETLLESLKEEGEKIPIYYLNKARHLGDQLLRTVKKIHVLHGDLHQDNILSHGEKWVTIGPKPLLGEHEYDLATYVINPLFPLISQDNAEAIILKRVEFFSDQFKFSKERIFNWCFIQAVLYWLNAIEDNEQKQKIESIKRLVQLCDGYTRQHP